MRLCSIDGCETKHQAKGFCKKHYYRIKSNNGVFRRSKFDKNEIISTDGFAVMDLYDMFGKKKAETMIDINDAQAVSGHKWYLGKKGYPTSRINGSLICLHQFITGLDRTDHIDGNPLNNQRKNLRQATQQQNVWNQKATGGSSKYKGVYLNKTRGTWDVQCKRKYYGSYNDEVSAAMAYNRAAIATFGQYARLNKI